LADVIINVKVQQKCTKAMAMYFHCLSDHKWQQQFKFVGDLAKPTMLTIARNTTPLPTMSTSTKNSSCHSLSWKCFRRNKWTRPWPLPRKVLQCSTCEGVITVNT
jgi:hypothetical protein